MAVFDFIVAGVLVPLGAWLALVPAPEPGARRSRLPRAALVVIAAAVRVCRRDLRRRRRLDPGPGVDRGRAPAVPGRARRSGVHLRDLGGRGADVHLAGRAPPRAPTGLAYRDSAGHRRPGRRLRRREVPAPAARSGDPARPGDRDRSRRRGLPGDRAELTAFTPRAG